MAKDDKRKAFWDEEEEESPSKKDIPGKTQRLPGTSAIPDADVVDQKIHETKVLMEQTHQLYQHYFNGVEKRPPAEKVRLLESKVKELERMNPATTANRFKLTQYLAQYATMKELWEKKLRDKEKK